MSNVNGKLLVYKSSAGSGKTYTLVNEYVNLLLKNPDNYRAILAITFTNKAANEMKERIVEELVKLSGSNAIDASIKDKAKRALTLIIHNYSEFSVSTIDHFVQRISRIFARDLNLSPNYEVELDSDRIMTNIVELLISKAGHDKELTDMLLNYIRSMVDEEVNWRIERSIAQSSETIFHDESTPFMDKLKAQKIELKDIAQIRNILHKEILNISNQVKKIANEACLLIESIGLTVNDFAQAGRGIGAYFYKLRESGAIIDAHNPNSYVLKAINDDVWTKKGAGNNVVMTITNSLRQFFYDMQNTDLETVLIYQHVLRNLYNMSLLNEIRNLLDNYIADNDLVPISEFNRKINDIIAQEPIPYIYARVGERFKHILIDEFQDTSKLQWHNLVPLIENSLSNDNFNMIIGDGKQSIYRWRGGDAKQFVDLPAITIENENLTDAGRNFKLNYNPKNLLYNYRSCKEIIDFNNSFYDFITKNLKIDELNRVYAEQQQLQPKNSKKDRGYVSIDFFDKKTSNDREEWYLNEVLKIVNQSIQRGYKYSDIAILCRKNSNNVSIANHLNRNNVPVVSKESLFLNADAHVRLMISLLSHISNPSVRLFQYEIILQLLTIHSEFQSEPILDAITQDSLNFKELLNKQMNYTLNVNALQRLSLYDMCEELIRIFGLNKTDDPYIITFLDTVHSCSTKNIAFIYQFLDWWNKHKDKLSLNMPDELNGVQMLTIHKAKGLQFPVVIYPFANQRLVRVDGYQWVELKQNENHPLPVIWGQLKSELSNTYLNKYIEAEKIQSTIDNINIMYVATTRAKEQLYILADKATTGNVTRVNDLIYQYVQLHTIDDSAKSDKHWEQGINNSQNNTKSIDIAPTHTTSPTNEFISTNWRNNVCAHLTYRDDDIIAEKRDRGILIHKLLSQIITSDDIGNVVNKAFTDGIIGDNSSNITKKLRSIVTSPELAPYFRKGLTVKNECEIVLPDAKTIIPDRLVFEGNDVTIIDYKTGIPTESHQQQIDNYANVLQQMGYVVINKIIYYTD